MRAERVFEGMVRSVQLRFSFKHYEKSRDKISLIFYEDFLDYSVETGLGQGARMKANRKRCHERRQTGDLFCRHKGENSMINSIGDE